MSRTCANCGIPIHWEPTLVDGLAYCCVGCAAGGPCTCDYGHLPQPGDFVSLVQASQVRAMVCFKQLSVERRNHR